MALTENAGRVYEWNEDPVYNDLPLDALAVVFEGSALGEDVSTGLFRALVSGDVFAGFCQRAVDNSAGAAGDLDVSVAQKGTVKLDVTAVALADHGADVHATDDGTFALAGGSVIGKVTRFISTGVAMVRFEATQLRSV